MLAGGTHVRGTLGHSLSAMQRATNTLCLEGLRQPVASEHNLASRDVANVVHVSGRQHQFFGLGAREQRGRSGRIGNVGILRATSRRGNHCYVVAKPTLIAKS